MLLDACTNVHSIHKWEVLFSSMCTFEKATYLFKVKVDAQKGAPRFKDFKKKDVLVSSNSCFHPLLSYGHSPQWLPCMFLLGFAFGFQVLQVRGSWSAHGFLDFCCSHGLWLSYQALVFVCLILQPSSYVQWIKWLFHWKAMKDFICKKGYIFHYI